MKGSVGVSKNISGKTIKRRLKVCHKCSSLYTLYNKKFKKKDLFNKTERFVCSLDQEFTKDGTRMIWKDCDGFETWDVPVDCDFKLEHTVMSQGEVK